MFRGKAIILLWIESRYVNAFLFIFIDVLVLWLISQSLHILQSYYLFHRARSGKNIILARSRVPIVSGELLQDSLNFPSVFIILNVIAIVVAFIATLGINGETIPRFVSFKASNVTSISKGIPLITSANYSKLENRLRPYSLSCFKRNTTSLSYWPVAYDSRVYDTIPINMQCPRGTDAEAPPTWEPLLKAECIAGRQYDNCTLDQIHSINWVWFSASTEVHSEIILPNRTIENRKIYKLSNTRQTSGNEAKNQFANRSGFAVVFGFYQPGTLRNVTLFVLDAPSNDYFFFGYGDAAFPSFGGNQFRIYDPVKVSPIELSRNGSRFMWAVSYGIGGSAVGVNGIFISTLIKIAFFLSSGTDQLKKVPYIVRHQDATSVSITSVVLIASLLFAFIVLNTLKVGLWRIIMCTEPSSEHFMQMNDFDQLSKLYQRDMERMNGFQKTNNFVELGFKTDDQSQRKLSPIF